MKNSTQEVTMPPDSPTIPSLIAAIICLTFIILWSEAGRWEAVGKLEECRTKEIQVECVVKMDTFSRDRFCAGFYAETRDCLECHKNHKSNWRR
jgi:hypothetical protein